MHHFVLHDILGVSSADEIIVDSGWWYRLNGWWVKAFLNPSVPEFTQLDSTPFPSSVSWCKIRNISTEGKTVLQCQRGEGRKKMINSYSNLVWLKQALSQKPMEFYLLKALRSEAIACWPVAVKPYGCFFFLTETIIYTFLTWTLGVPLSWKYCILMWGKAGFASILELCWFVCQSSSNTLHFGQV